MRIKGGIGVGLIIVAGLFLLGGCHSSMSQESTRRCNSLCDLSYRWLYKDLDSAYSYARQAQTIARDNSENRAQALNSLAFVRFMQMDFVGSRSEYLRAYSLSNNILYQLVSEIGLMRICQRTSENVDFYMYRNSAQRHIRRIQEDKEELNEHELHIFQLSVQDFHTISASYFLNLQQTRRAASEIEAFIPDENLMKADTAQWLSINYLKSTFKFVAGKTYMEKNLNAFDALIYGLRISRENGYNYFTAKYLQGLAILLNRPDVIRGIEQERPLGLQILNPARVPLHLLPEAVAKEALGVAESYRDIYLESVCWRVLAGCYFRQGQYHRALEALCHALDEVNEHYTAHYKQIKTPHLLVPFNPADSVSVEKMWMSNSRVLTVPEWIARIREQFSLVYSALGDKMRSDYNRNIYLDILEVTRQDKETEVRYRELQNESRQLNILLIVVVISILCALLILYYFRRKWSVSHRLRILKLRKTLEISRNLTSAMPEEVSDEDELFRQLSVAVQGQIAYLFGSVRIIKEPNSEEIRVMADGNLSKDEKIMLDVVSCFMTWAFAQGKNLVLLGEKSRIIREKRDFLERKILENKKENEIRRACISLVNNVTPLIDRILHELSRLNEGDNSARAASLRTGRYEYIGELADKINDYNNLLTHWIQIRQGMFNLHIESFPLKDLFSIIGQRQRLFEREDKQLVIHPTEAIVKADRLLTLFMLNTLVENAFKYTSKGDKTEVSATENEELVEISVCDTGIGLSSADCERILHSKVYDSSSIGLSEGTSNEALKKKKGFGFGLMNCKGIIEKYRKTNNLFNVCLFGIESTLGKGSRFFFRLPGGGKSTVFLLLTVLFLTACGPSSPRSSKVVWKPDDALLSRASIFADSVYYSNIMGRYDRALQFADSARRCLNAYYLKENPGGKDVLKAYGEGDPTELKWFNANFNTDYHVILDIRNESAVAALALRDWQLYKYNNTAYTSLFKLLGEDHRLGDYCRRMQRSSNNKIILIVIFLLCSVSFAVAYYIIYFRRRTLFIINLKQILEINKNLMNTVSRGPEALQHILDELCRSMVEIAPVKSLTVAVYDEEMKKLVFFSTGKCDNEEQLHLDLEQTFKADTSSVHQEGHGFIAPLVVEWGTLHQCIGAWHVSFEREEANDSLELLFTFISRSLANYLFHSIVRINRKKRDLELAEDDNLRAYRESSRLYVQNRVLDNCLSTIKHETMFYPSRIRQLAASVGQVGHIRKEDQASVAEMYELAAYYKKIYSLLTLNADRQLATSVFKCTNVKVETLFKQIEADYVRMAKKHVEQLLLKINYDNAALYVKGDTQLLYFLLRNMLAAALAHPSAGRLELSACRQGEYVKFLLKDSRIFFEKCDLRLLFSPEGCSLQPSDAVAIGTEYLICKQIVRDHAAYTANRGCRINAELWPEGGYVLWFTIPESQTNYEYEKV